jgi:hypothetical protein
MQLLGKEPVLVNLTDVYPKLNRESETRILLQFSVPLTGKVSGHAHDSIAIAVTALSDPHGSVTNCEIEAEFEGVRVEIYGLAEHKAKSLHPLCLLTTCTLRKLVVSRPKKQPELNEGDIQLSFNTTVPFSKSIWSFGGEYYGKTVFVQFSEGQMVLPADEGDSSDEDQPSLLGVDVPQQSDERRKAVEEIETAPKKRGPKPGSKKAKK